MKTVCLYETAGLLNFRQRTMSKQFQSQTEAAVSPVATATACESLFGRAIIDTYRATMEV